MKHGLSISADSIEMTKEQRELLDFLVKTVTELDTEKIIRGIYLSPLDVTNGKLNKLFTPIVHYDEDELYPCELKCRVKKVTDYIIEYENYSPYLPENPIVLWSEEGRQNDTHTRSY